MDTVLYKFLAEVDHKRQPQVEQAQIGESLGFEDRVIDCYRFGFNNDKFRNQKIKAERRGKLLAFIPDRHLHLPLN